MIDNETTLLKRPNNTEINNYRSLYGLQQYVTQEQMTTTELQAPD